ncbi:DUF885 domain-containing protein [Paucibacter sp. TC2R-5]|uniref:DUF885 domain-containing protein n=1 Tax=Paucibacter sp. TC2R-5 TaxID=2893555 RepID=UPI0021E3B498|nr:DUF885 domain-containing protein [Paucibacter sp. TC2R-5]MCV2360075.1 DUF885 domain-containing protein [Paucibacter sp. TC2R-5]
MKNRNSVAALALGALVLLLALAPLGASAASAASGTSIGAAPGGSARPPAASVSKQEAKRLQQLLSDYYLARSRYEPLGASASGDQRFDDQLGLSIAPHLQAKQYALYRQFAARLQQIKPAQLGQADRINYEILDYELAEALSFEPFPTHLLPIDQEDSVPVQLANYSSGDGPQALSTPKQYWAYLNRLRQLTPWIDQAIANMREGIQTGIVPPKALVVAALPQHQQIVSSTAEASVFYSPIKRLEAGATAGFSAAERRRLGAAYRREIDTHLNPALARLAQFLQTDYLPASRSSAGLGALPNGEKWYRAAVASATGSLLDPAQIHAIGLTEVARIQQQFELLGPKLGYSGPAADLPQWVAAQDRFRPFNSADEVNDWFRRLDRQLDGKLPALFSLMPKAGLEVRLEPELTRATASDHYTSPSADGQRPGVFWSVVNDPRRYDSTQMSSLFLHEGRPGHHFQIALQQELNLPDFRKFGGNNAFMEGWALYAETLGQEMGLYEDTAQYFGHLNSELLRAARLVVDTGLHAQGWTREQAIQYLQSTLGYDLDEATSAIERYMASPGQALGYKIGAMKIAALRQRASKALGAKFSLPAFHAAVIGEGCLPLPVLEAKVERWIEAQK